MNFTRLVFPTMFAIGLLAMGSAIAQDLPYKEGSVWNVSFIKVKPGMLNTYIRDLMASRKPIMEEAKKEGLILSEKMLVGTSTNRDDFNMIILVEYKNWAALDGLAAKFEALSSKALGSEDKRMQINVKRTDMREILGNKNMQEVTYK